jgi:16S rRNA processing protein RimM
VTSELLVVGRVGRPHGLDGSFVVEDASDDERRFVEGAKLLHDGVEATVVASKRSGGRRVIRLDLPVQRGASLCVRRADLPQPAAGHYYVADLVGLTVVEDGGEELGRVDRVEEGVANDVLVLDSGSLLPMVDACVREIDLEAARIVVARGFADAG